MNQTTRLPVVSKTARSLAVSKTARLLATLAVGATVAVCATSFASRPLVAAAPAGVADLASRSPEPSRPERPPAAGFRRISDADLRALSLGPQDKAARDALAQGRFADAARSIAATSPEQRFAQAYSASRASDFERVKDVLSGPQDFGVLSADVRLLLAEAEVELGHADVGLSLVALETSGLGRRLRLRALREVGRLVDARAVASALVASGLPDDVAYGLLQLATLEVLEGQRAKALPHLRRLDVESPLHGFAARGRKLALELIEASPSLAAAYESRTPVEVLTRGETLLDAHQNADAVTELSSISGVTLRGAELCKHRYLLGRAHRKARQWKDALEVLTEAMTTCKKAASDLEPWALFQLGAVQERLSKEDDAAATYTSLLEHHGQHSLADDAGFFLVRHTLDDKQDFKAARRLAERLVREHPTGDLVEEAVFFVVVAALVDGRWDDAAEVMALYDRLPRPDFRDHDAGRTSYWRGRIAEHAGRAALASAHYTSVLSTYPLGWYSLLSYARLREADPKSARAAFRDAMTTDVDRPSLPGIGPSPFAFDLPAGPPLERALLLTRLGLATAAREALGPLSESADPFFLPFALDRAGFYRESHDLLRRQLDVFRRFTPSGSGRNLWTIAFPAPHRDLVDRHAKSAGIPPAFAWAIMREESGFNLAIESSANAMGLMQLIVPTAKRTAQMLKLDPATVDRAALTDPDLNIRLGTRYLAYVQERAGGKNALPLLPAGYNAGEGALLRWLGQRGGLPMDLFVETIPFEEARWYTKRVVASYAVYRYLYFGGETADDPVPYFGQKLPRPEGKGR